MTVQPFRIEPALPPQAMKTYRVSAPLSTHYGPATCEDVDCEHWRHGWETTVDESTDLGQGQAHYIRREAGRRFAEDRGEDGLTRFTFEAGQECFGRHRARNGRPERYLVVGGDWRGNPAGERREFSGPEAWTSDFAEHQDKLRRQVGA